MEEEVIVISDEEAAEPPPETIVEDCESSAAEQEGADSDATEPRPGSRGDHEKRDPRRREEAGGAAPAVPTHLLPGRAALMVTVYNTSPSTTRNLLRWYSPPNRFTSAWSSWMVGAERIVPRGKTLHPRGISGSNVAATSPSISSSSGSHPSSRSSISRRSSLSVGDAAASCGSSGAEDGDIQGGLSSAACASRTGPGFAAGWSASSATI
ncbi:hypothetical protein ACLKA6_005814 [Drosophila palustris]